MNISIMNYRADHPVPEGRQFVAILTAGETHTRMDKLHTSSTSMLFYGTSAAEARSKALEWWEREVGKERDRQAAAERRIQAAKKGRAA